MIIYYLICLKFHRTNLEDVNKLEVTGKIPALHISGQYHSEGLLVNFPLHSSGSFLVNMSMVIVTISLVPLTEKLAYYINS